MRASTVACLTLLAGCAAPAPVVTPRVSGGNPADGIVTLASTRTLFDPVEPDWRAALATADNQCRADGRAPPARFAGEQTSCELYDRGGRCLRATRTRFYSCGE
ncbi:YecR family lipoprotein [Amaricoccus solimangrovi]|uniref:Lipoprotein n=1 Tax=Amaricoccus solimangrovi TaxID=2589815 RepID=A0A501WVR1_9RHOB|nr:YecR family lipoprotein [Amaricoccus solimangrovi]TPE53508.1 hypothetical protein FJM51_00195 [Amaricoccus solimangrovi]